ncbi:XdhC family protein [Alteromonas sp. ASW11-19]|uniref:XdhC family protein n=1 Tax=Alteromonas salexigens TaxID=2982530 RepID=A0ABT2VL56_9ALTE|nr:XdhC/CoxI family protein [Alteromonas salexigens]MCU7554035.1 XdhC family protein [Alteromonas salexigens]
MKHHLYHVLSRWEPQKEAHRWLLATIVGTQGSSYRKSGAMMLFSDQGEQLGVVSGGCLESDILHQARRCWETGQARTVTYDMQEEGDIAWRLGIGCGGEVTLLLQPVTPNNQYLHLEKVLRALQRGESVRYGQALTSPDAEAAVLDTEAPSDDANWFWQTITPPPALVILGGGVDAQPVARIAGTLGWRVTVNDVRARYARAGDFPDVQLVADLAPETLPEADWFTSADAIIVMHHQVHMDASALAAVAQVQSGALRYLALLGPMHRCDQVLAQASLAEADLTVPLQAPAGLALGGELPESIALSMIAQAHAVLHGQSAAPLKGKPCRSA